jgi:hypothetical protein
MELEPEIIRPGENSYPSENPNDEEPDLLPEYSHYPDEGCEFAHSCLDCPFPRCIYDEPGGKQRFIKDLRNKEMLRLYTGGKEIKELAITFGVSQRTVQRALKRAKNE